jgi:hypothetical protein
MVVHILLWPACQVVVISCSTGGQPSGGAGDLGAMLEARWRSCRRGKMEIMPRRKMEIKARKEKGPYHITYYNCM